MTNTSDSFERLKRENDEAEAALLALADRPLSERMAAALDVYTTRRALATEGPSLRSAMAEALADLIPSGDAEPGDA